MQKGVYKDNIEEVLASFGYKLLDKWMSNNGLVVKIRDMNGFLYEVKYHQLKQNHIPTIAYKTNPHSIYNIKLWCKLNEIQIELLSDTYKTAKTKMVWRCLDNDCNEEFDECWDKIFQGRKCPYCSGKRVGMSNCLATLKPILAEEWHPTKNGKLTPYDVTCRCGKHVWFKCKVCDYEWNTRIADRADCGCPKCAIENRKGDKNFNWNGGISSIEKYLRYKMLEWSKETRKFYNNRCIFTNSTRGLAIHHVYPFYNILIETFQITNIEIKSVINQYTDNELEMLTTVCKELHIKYGLGVLMTVDIHREFHKLYGYKNNTPEQFEEFRELRLKQLKSENKEVAS